MKIIITVNLPDHDMSKLWVQKKAQELQRMSEYHIRQDLTPHGHGDENTTIDVTAKVEA